MIQPGEGTGGGLMKHPPPGAPSQWLADVVVDDESVDREAKGAGGPVMKDVLKVPDMGWFSIILDPSGAALGLWQTRAVT